jgi:triacylglycerol lipase
VNSFRPVNSVVHLERLARSGARAARRPAQLRVIALEAAWAAAHLATYPLGVARERLRPDGDRYGLDSLPPLQRSLFISDVAAAGTPILLVHGVLDNRSVFTLLRRALVRRGFGRVRTLNYPIYTHDVRAAADRLSSEVERLAEESGYERVHLVGHSLGGIIARYYAQRLGGDRRVHTVVTLGSPHAGTELARFAPAGVLRQLRPDSDLVAELAAPAPDCRTRFVAFWSDHDEMVQPRGAARIEHPDLLADNVLVPGVGHLSLPIHSEVTRGVCAVLAELDTAGEAARPATSRRQRTLRRAQSALGMLPERPA